MQLSTDSREKCKREVCNGINKYIFTHEKLKSHLFLVQKREKYKNNFYWFDRHCIDGTNKTRFLTLAVRELFNPNRISRDIANRNLNSTLLEMMRFFLNK